MVNVPDKVRTLLNDPDAVKVIATASKDGTPHAIVVGSGMSPAPDLVVAGEVMMKTTSANLKANPKVGVLVAKGPEAYLVVAENPKLVKEGEIYDKMNEELSK
ncbi:MAG TPA: pyridoxamine 5'-phosphate oxidase family protein, partial [Candidatus Methanomethylophilaceae archaeon]|nr:pyridoxamine 5'-phosphate oxidase family protein [Candidatus Methanomethylophilaceae archaeon]